MVGCSVPVLRFCAFVAMVSANRVSLPLMPEDASQRNSVVKVPELDSRNLTDERAWGNYSPAPCFTASLDIIDKIINPYALGWHCLFL